MTYSDAALKAAGWHDDAKRAKFAALMQRANEAIEAQTGFGLEDFADADYASLFEDTDGEATFEDVIELLADTDPYFAALWDAQ